LENREGVPNRFTHESIHQEYIACSNWDSVERMWALIWRC
jgi:hypothetical protein